MNRIKRLAIMAALFGFIFDILTIFEPLQNDFVNSCETPCRCCSLFSIEQSKFLDWIAEQIRGQEGG